ncbi:hypothetical protein HNP93_001709 [Methanococcus maripaludis]|uniref:Parallel beta-helix repeat protein n=1 Tax=Methanococcus maripaludis TaxID=39152 RepID=A0A7J9P8C7_METMI|nr:NosD domain-containing protein [Methanococcus maripaludis]MBA2859008.1 hypothetical protein [Methanococcus maripaludis]
MIKKCLFLFLLLFAVGYVNAGSVDYTINETDYINQTSIELDMPYQAFVIITEPGEYTVTADFVNNSLTNGDIVILIKNTENVTLNCNDKWFNTTSTDYAVPVYVYNSTNVTVKNLKSDWIPGDAITFGYTNNSVIKDSEIICEYEGIWIYDSYGCEISGNTITINDEIYAYGISLDYLVNSTIFDNTINVNAGSSEAFGIYVDYDTINSTISGNKIDVNSEIDYAYGISSYYNITDSTISENEITTRAYKEAYGICTYVDDEYANNITNSIITGNTINTTSINADAYGIFAYLNIQDSTISENDILISAYYVDYEYADAYGICAYGDISNTTIENNEIDLYSENSGSCGINAEYDITNTLISGNTITASTDDDIYCIVAWDEIINSTIYDNAIDAYSVNGYVYAIYVSSGIINAIISENNLDVYGDDFTYGICAYEYLINTTVENNEITATSEDYDAYGICAGEYDAQMINSIISGNTIEVNASGDDYGACGIFWYYAETSTVENNEITATSEDYDASGIYSEDYFINGTISGNTVNAYSEYDDAYGIYIDEIINNSVISENDVISTSERDYAKGMEIGNPINSNVSGNTFTVTAGESGAYAYGTYIDDMKNCIISENALTILSKNEKAYGAYVSGYVTDTIFSKTNITADAPGNVYGIYFDGYVTNSTIEDSIITATSEENSASGIYSYQGEYETYSGNTITIDAPEAYGFDIDNIANMTISGNTIDVNSEYSLAASMCIVDISNSTITENTFTSNGYALHIDSGCLNNRFYLNNIKGLVNNGTNNYFVSSEPITYSYLGNSYTSILGNYWASYDEADTNGDGIIDTPYAVNDTNDTKPLADMWNNGEIGNYVAPTAPRSSGGGGRSYDSDISDEIGSKVIKNFVSSATVLFGNGIDEQYAVQLRERVTDANGYTISGNAVIVGGPLANGFAKEYNNQFEMPISNDYPGENKGVIQVLKVQDNSGNVVKSYTIVYIAGSDRLGTQAALEYFKTLDELPEGPVMIEWTENGPVLVE